MAVADKAPRAVGPAPITTVDVQARVSAFTNHTLSTFIAASANQAELPFKQLALPVIRSEVLVLLLVAEFRCHVARSHGCNPEISGREVKQRRTHQIVSSAVFNHTWACFPSEKS